MTNPPRILVTGAGGFVGGHLLPALRSTFPNAHILAPSAAALDIADAAAIEAHMEAHPPDICIHLAAIAAIPASRRDPQLAWRVNLHGTLDLAGSVLRHAPHCVFLYPSSADAYGRSFTAHPVDERTPLLPMNVYGATKAAAEMGLSALVAEGLRAIILRPFNHTGPGQSASFVVPAFARQVARIEAGLQPPVLQVGALAPARDFLDVRDVCAGYVEAIRRTEALRPGTILNLASGVPRRIGDILDALMQLANVEAEIKTESLLLRPGEIASATGDAGAARTLLEWGPAIKWNTTLMDVLQDWRGRVHAE